MRICVSRYIQPASALLVIGFIFTLIGGCGGGGNASSPFFSHPPASSVSLPSGSPPPSGNPLTTGGIQGHFFLVNGKLVTGTTTGSPAGPPALATVSILPPQITLPSPLPSGIGTPNLSPSPFAAPATQCDANGFFILSGLPVGPFNLVANLNGISITMPVTIIAGTTVDIDSPPISHQQALSIAKGLALTNSIDIRLILAPQQPLPPGTSIVPYVPFDNNLNPIAPTIVQTPTWFFFINPAADFNFEHPVQYVLVDANTGASTSIAANYPPRINNNDIYQNPGFDFIEPDLADVNVPANFGVSSLPSEITAKTAQPPVSTVQTDSTPCCPDAKTVALLVQGSDTSLTSLLGGGTAVLGAEGFDAMAIQKLFGKVGFPPPGLVTTFPAYESAHPAMDFIKAFNTVAQSARPCDTLVLYYSGHGEPDNGVGGSGGFLTMDTSGNPEEVQRYVSFRHSTQGSFFIREGIPVPVVDFSQTKACHVYVIIEACEIGGITHDGHDIDSWLGLAAPGRTVAVLTSSSNNTSSPFRLPEVKYILPFIPVGGFFTQNLVFDSLLSPTSDSLAALKFGYANVVLHDQSSTLLTSNLPRMFSTVVPGQCLSCPSPSPSPSTGAAWSMALHDAQGTSRTTADTSKDVGVVQWTYNAPCAGTEPVIGADGTIYVCGNNGNGVFAINPDGSSKWVYAAPHQGLTIPAVASDGTVYVGSPVDNNVYAVNPDGSAKWTFASLASPTAPILGPDGTIYFRNQFSVFALNPDGSLKWKYDSGGSNVSPTLAADGTIYVPGAPLVALNPNGTVKWTQNLTPPSPTPAPSAPASVVVAPQGTLVCSYLDSNSFNNLETLSPADGSLVNNAANNTFFSSNGFTLGNLMAVGSDGTIYVQAAKGGSVYGLFALNLDFTLKWKLQLQLPTTAIAGYQPAIGGDGTIFFGVNPLYAISPAGGVKWTVQTGAANNGAALFALATVSIGPDGTLYLPEKGTASAPSNISNIAAIR